MGPEGLGPRVQCAAVPVFLVRHAHAGNRSQWKGPDAARPVSERGAAQSRALADELADVGIGRIVASPTERCIQTVAPLAERLGLEVRTRKLLAADADPDAAIAYLIAHADEQPALCSHGELIPKVIGRLVALGMKTKAEVAAEKASVWVLEVDRGRVVRGRYLPPPKVRG